MGTSPRHTQRGLRKIFLCMKGGEEVYIPEFVCGIGFTLAVEVLAAVIWSIYDDKKKRKGKK